MAYDEATAERVRKLLSGRRDVAEKRMMGGLCFMVKGAMCCAVSGQGGLLVRVGAAAQGEVLREPHVKPMEMRRRSRRLSERACAKEMGGAWRRLCLDVAGSRDARSQPAQCADAGG